MKHKRLWLLALILMVFYLPVPGVAAPPGPKKGAEGDLPLHITAAKLEADQKEGVIVFSGQVKAQYGDSTLYADQLRVYFQGGPGAGPAPETKDASPLGNLGGEKVSRIVARGQVRFVQGERVATGDEAVYYKDREEVVLLGNPQLWRAENTLKGERIVFNMRNNKVLVESSSQKRVEAHLYPAGPGPAGDKGTLPPGGKGRKARQP